MTQSGTLRCSPTVCRVADIRSIYIVYRFRDARGLTLAVCQTSNATIMQTQWPLSLRGYAKKKISKPTERLANLLMLSYEPMLVWSLDGPIEFWNAGAERLYGF